MSVRPSLHYNYSLIPSLICIVTISYRKNEFLWYLGNVSYVSLDTYSRTGQHTSLDLESDVRLYNALPWNRLATLCDTLNKEA